MLNGYDDSRINAIVLLTDGRNEDGVPEDDVDQLDGLLAELRPAVRAKPPAPSASSRSPTAPTPTSPPCGGSRTRQPARPRLEQPDGHQRRLRRRGVQFLIVALRFRDRFFTPPVAQSDDLTPRDRPRRWCDRGSSIVAGLPWIAAAGIGAVAWGTRVALAIPRAPKRERIDPFTLGEPWRSFVRAALQAKPASTGPSTPRGRDRCVTASRRSVSGWAPGRRVWQAANRTQEGREHARTARYSSGHVRSWRHSSRSRARQPRTGTRTAEALRSDRIRRTYGDGRRRRRDRLRLLDARLDEAVRGPSSCRSTAGTPKACWDCPRTSTASSRTWRRSVKRSRRPAALRAEDQALLR